MFENISISNYCQRILNLCKSKKQVTDDDIHVEEIVSTIYNKEENVPETVQVLNSTVQIQETKQEAVTEAPKVESIQKVSKKTYSEVLRQPPNVKQQNETNKQTDLKEEYNTSRRGRKSRNRRNTNYAKERIETNTDREYNNNNRGGNRAGRNHRGRGRNRRGASREGQHANNNINSLGNEGCHRPPRGNSGRSSHRGNRRGGRGFVHGGINKSNNLGSSGIFSYSNAVSKTKDENQNKVQSEANKTQPVVFNYYIIKNYVIKDGVENEVSTEIIKTGTSKHFL